MHIKLVLSLIFLGSFLQINSQTQYSLADVPSHLLKGSNSVLLDESIEVDVTELGKQKITTYRAQLVLNKKGKFDAWSYAVYDKGTKISKIESTVYNAFGAEIDRFKKRDFKDVSAVDSYSIYSDDRLLYLEYTPTVYPYIVVFKSVVEDNSTAFILDWKPVKGYAKSTVKSTYKIKFDPSNKPRFKASNLDGFSVSISENPNELVFEANDIKALKYEELTPHKSNIFPSVSFVLYNFSLKGMQGYAENWQEFGSWLQSNLLNDVGDLPESTILEIKNLVHQKETNVEKAKVVYNYLQEKVRYISVQIDIGGWKPMPASDVDKLSYGDCKALTNYTKAILDKLDIPSYYTVLFGSEKEVDISSEYYGIEGNHAILGIPENNEIIWLECTNQDIPFGYIGNLSDDRDVLIFTPEGGKIVHTKVYNFSENTQNTTATLIINSQGDLISNFSRDYRGLKYDDKFYLNRESKEDLKEYYLNKWPYLNGYIPKNIKINDNKKEVVFTEKMDIDIPSYCSTVGENLLFCPNAFNQFQNVPPRIKERKQELYISKGFIENDSITVKVPMNFKVDSFPEDKLIENVFGSYSISFKKTSEDTFIYNRQFILKKNTYPPEEYNNYRNFIKKVAKLDRSKLLLTKTID